MYRPRPLPDGGPSVAGVTESAFLTPIGHKNNNADPLGPGAIALAITGAWAAAWIISSWAGVYSGPFWCFWPLRARGQVKPSRCWGQAPRTPRVITCNPIWDSAGGWCSLTRGTRAIIRPRSEDNDKRQVQRDTSMPHRSARRTGRPPWRPTPQSGKPGSRGVEQNSAPEARGSTAAGAEATTVWLALPLQTCPSNLQIEDELQHAFRRHRDD